MRAHNKVAFLSGSGARFTGSIVKMQALGDYNSSSTLKRIEYGNLTFPESEFSPSLTLQSGSGQLVNLSGVEVPNGSYLDGPIARVACEEGNWLIYYHQ